MLDVTLRQLWWKLWDHVRPHNNKWRSIESAPKDGSIFLGWQSLEPFPVAIRWSCGEWVYADCALRGAVGEAGEVTHWMPFPTLPERPWQEGRAGWHPLVEA